MAPIIFEDTFEIVSINPDGKKFDKVSRIEGKGNKFDVHIMLDVNIDVYPINMEKRYTIALAPTLDLDGTPDSGYFNNQSGRDTLMDRYEYIMHGRLFKITDNKNLTPPKSEVYISFGGLLMLLRVDTSTAAKFDLDMRLFLLMKTTE
ncbi:hypothetical protein Droror1_Dr00015633 [Drosera rotundifolia]